MTPIEFKGCNVTYGADQPEFLPLPAMKFPDGEVITCWQFTDNEIEELQKSRCVFLSQLTYNSPLQPVRLTLALDDGMGLN